MTSYPRYFLVAGGSRDQCHYKVKVPEKEKSNYEWGKKIGELQRKSREGASNPELGGGNGSPKIGNPPKPPVTPKQPVVVPLPTPDTQFRQIYLIYLGFQ